MRRISYGRKEQQRRVQSRPGALPLMLLLAAMGSGVVFPTSKDAPKEVYGPDNGESILQASEKKLDRLDALITPACVQYDILKDNPGKKFDDGEVFIDHTTIMLALGRAKHNDETGNIELVDDDERDLFSGLGGEK